MSVSHFQVARQFETAVKGHDFSRAESAAKSGGFSPWGTVIFKPNQYLFSRVADARETPGSRSFRQGQQPLRADLQVVPS